MTGCQPPHHGRKAFSHDSVDSVNAPNLPPAAMLTGFQRADDNTDMAVPRITKEDLKPRIEAADESARPVLVDARLKYPFEHSTAKLPGALRAAPGADALPALPKQRDVVVYDSDPNEVTATRVAADLIKSGYQVSVLKGGFGEWIGANLPIETKNAIRPAPAPAPAVAPPAAPAAAPAAQPPAAAKA